MDIAKAVNELLAKNDMTQADLARATGFNTAWVSMVCKGKIKDTSLDKALVLSKALNVSVDEFAHIAGWTN